MTTTYHEAIMALSRIGGLCLPAIDEAASEGAPAERDDIEAIASACGTVREWMEAHPDRPLTGAETQERSRVAVLESIDRRLAALDGRLAGPQRAESPTPITIAAKAGEFATALLAARDVGMEAEAQVIIEDIVGDAVAQELQRLRERVAELEVDASYAARVLISAAKAYTNGYMSIIPRDEDGTALSGVFVAVDGGLAMLIEEVIQAAYDEADDEGFDEPEACELCGGQLSDPADGWCEDCATANGEEG